jgi:hypothetical protein
MQHIDIYKREEEEKEKCRDKLLSKDKFIFTTYFIFLSLN